jgi:hypothetical protein
MRRATAILALLSCGLAVTSIYLWRELGQERARDAEFRALLETPAAQSASVQATSAPPPTAAVSPSGPSPATVLPATATPSPPKMTGSQEDWVSYRRRMMRDPKYREVLRDQNRLALAPRRANLIRLLGFTPAQADVVIDMQIERDFQFADQVIPPTEELRQQQRQRAEAQEKEYQAKLLDLLGSDQNARLEHYMETRQTRMQVDTLRTQLNGADILRDDQVEPLIEALQVERSRMQEELQQYRDTLNFEGQANDPWQRYNERQAELMKKMNADMHSSAAAILSSSQLDQLDAMLGRELQRHEAQMRISRIERNLDSANRAAAPAN